MIRSFVFAAAPMLLLCAAPALCQEPGGQLGAGPFVVDQEVRERWLQGGQHPGFVPFELRRNQIHVQPRSAMAMPNGGTSISAVATGTAPCSSIPGTT